MPLLARPAVAALAARAMQRTTRLADRRPGGRGSAATHARFPEYPRTVRELTIPTSVAPARAVVYLPAGGSAAAPPAHVNFHGGGYVMTLTETDDPL